MFICGECGAKFDKIDECWEHVETCDPVRDDWFPGQGRTVPCPECNGTGEYRGNECHDCRGYGETIRFCLRCWDSGYLGMGPVHDLASCDAEGCDAGAAIREARDSQTGIYSPDYLARVGRSDYRRP